MEDKFSLINAIALVIGGCSSNLFAGAICDANEKDFFFKAKVCIIMSILCIPLSCVTFLVTTNFYVSMTFLFLEYLLAEGYGSPAISMYQ